VGVSHLVTSLVDSIVVRTNVTWRNIGMANNGMKNLADSSTSTKFVSMLEKAEAAAGTLLNNWESEFVSEMRTQFETREQAIDLGVQPWNPTVKQWNTLHTIVSAL
jgi:hypothetical protein